MNINNIDEFSCTLSPLDYHIAEQANRQNISFYYKEYPNNLENMILSIFDYKKTKWQCPSCLHNCSRTHQFKIKRPLLVCNNCGHNCIK